MSSIMITIMLSTIMMSTIMMSTIMMRTIMSTIRLEVMVIQLVQQHSLASFPTKTTGPSFDNIWPKLPL